MELTEKEVAFLESLKNSQEWPNSYTFKFVFKCDQGHEERIFSIFENNEIKSTVKDSKKANFKSLTIIHKSTHPEEILSIYKEVHQVKGIIAL